MDFDKLCNVFLKLNKKIRFVGILNSRGGRVTQKFRDNSTSLLSADELKMLIYYTVDRRNRLQNLQHKLGKVKETTNRYENTSTITLFLDKNMILVSTDPSSNISKITSDMWRILEKKKANKRQVKKSASKTTASKKRISKKKIQRVSKK